MLPMHAHPIAPAGTAATEIAIGNPNHMRYLLALLSKRLPNEMPFGIVYDPKERCLRCTVNAPFGLDCAHQDRFRRAFARCNQVLCECPGTSRFRLGNFFPANMRLTGTLNAVLDTQADQDAASVMEAVSDILVADILTDGSQLRQHCAEYTDECLRGIGV